MESTQIHLPVAIIASSCLGSQFSLMQDSKTVFNAVFSAVWRSQNFSCFDFLDPTFICLNSSHAVLQTALFSFSMATVSNNISNRTFHGKDFTALLIDQPYVNLSSENIATVVGVPLGVAFLLLVLLHVGGLLVGLGLRRRG